MAESAVNQMERSKKIVQISVIGIIVNLIMIALKGAVGAVTGSIAIMMDAVNNLSDMLGSVITIVGTKLAGKAPDKKHPYGYGRIEQISTVTISGIVLIAGFTAFRESVKSILEPQAANYTVVSLVIIAVAALTKFLLGQYVQREGKQYNADSLIASGTEAVFDSAISLSTLVAAVVSMVWHVSIEGWLGTAISILILKAGVELLLESLGDMIGTRIDRELSLNLKRDICKHPHVLGAYDLVLHRYGPDRLIGSVHVELPDEISAREIHRLTRNITEEVRRDYGITLTVGIYASNTASEESARMRAHLLELIAAYPDILQMHGFYMDAERRQVSFDLVIDYKSKRRIEIRDAVIEQMRERYEGYGFSVILDGDYSD